jgi:hypothetical protein
VLELQVMFRHPGGNATPPVADTSIAGRTSPEIQSAEPVSANALGSELPTLLEGSALADAVAEVDRTLIHLAMERTLAERLRAGVAMARLAARFRR